jgi:hypothetical protein
MTSQQERPAGSDVVASWRRDDVHRVRVAFLVGVALVFFGLAVVAALVGRP